MPRRMGQPPKVETLYQLRAMPRRTGRPPKVEAPLPWPKLRSWKNQVMRPLLLQRRLRKKTSDRNYAFPWSVPRGVVADCNKPCGKYDRHIRNQWNPTKPNSIECEFGRDRFCNNNLSLTNSLVFFYIIRYSPRPRVHQNHSQCTEHSWPRCERHPNGDLPSPVSQCHSPQSTPTWPA